MNVEEGMRWTCIRCGRCCSNVSIQGWINEALREEVDMIDGGKCGFLDDDNRCLQYEKRPNPCRRYPFVISRQGNEHILKVHSKCGGIGFGDEIDIPKTMMYILKLYENDLGFEFMVRSVEGSTGRFHFYRT
jgi:Fe-S-cluster containining protein